MSYLESSADRKKICESLREFLSDSAVLYIKTHGFHWNIEGENFYSLHLFFEEQYTDLWKSLDEIAERIRALGSPAPSSFAEFLKFSTLKETSQALSGKEMLEELRNDTLTLTKKASQISALAEKFEDRATTDMLTERATQLEKNIWMLNSHLAS